MPITKHIAQMILLSGKAGAEDRELQRKHGIDTSRGIDPFDPKVIRWAFEARTEERNLEKYLNDLDAETLLLLEALMYHGRDGGQFDKTLAYLRGLNDSKHELVRTIVEKRSPSLCTSRKHYRT